MDKILPGELSDILWQKVAVKLDSIILKYESLPEGVQFHTKMIFPAAAVYLTMKDAVGEEGAYKIIEDSAVHGCEGIADNLQKMMKIPGMKSLFVNIWDPMTKKVFGPGNGFKNRFYPKKKGGRFF